MSKKGKIILYTTASLVVIAFLCFANWLYGDPIPENEAKNIAIEYVEEKHSGEGFKYESSGYNFKFDEYYVNFSKKNSKDKHFWVTVNSRGNIVDDGYENIANLSNTYERLYEEYSNFMDDYLEAIAADYHIEGVYENDSFMMCELVFDENLENDNNKLINKRTLKISDLEVDKDYDIRELSKNLGSLIAVIYVKDVSTEKACEVALKVKTDLVKEHIEFQELKVNLREYIPEEDKKTTEEESLKFTISYDKICDDKLELKKRIEKLIDEQYDYYHPKKN